MYGNIHRDVVAADHLVAFSTSRTVAVNSSLLTAGRTATSVSRLNTAHGVAIRIVDTTRLLVAAPLFLNKQSVASPLYSSITELVPLMRLIGKSKVVCRDLSRSSDCK